MAVIVVGVDHSEGAKAALRFALEEATLRQATLRVVHAWQYGYIGATGFEGSYPALGGDIKELRDAAESGLGRDAAGGNPGDGHGGDRAARGEDAAGCRAGR